jgi:hypothetical protein
MAANSWRSDSACADKAARKAGAGRHDSRTGLIFARFTIRSCCLYTVAEPPLRRRRSGVVGGTRA